VSDNSAIEWTDATWSPTLGCTNVSPGCDHCYAMRTVHRMAFNPNEKVSAAAEGLTAYRPGVGVVWTNMVRTLPDRLDLPLRWRKPRRVFVDSQSDLFHDQVPDEFIARVFAVMALAGRHTFQLLTKRHGRMRSLLSQHDRWNILLTEALSSVLDNADAVIPAVDVDRADMWLRAREYRTDPLPPLANVWLGCSVENQQWADVRIPALLETPAAVRFLSCEPLLGPVRLTAWLDPSLLCLSGCADLPTGSRTNCSVACRQLGGTMGTIDWVIAGGESGSGARLMHPEWLRSLRDQCVSAGVPFHFKQWGEWLPYEPDAQQPFWTAPNRNYVDGHVLPATLSDGEPVDGWWAPHPDSVVYQRAGKKAAGRELDGRTWDEYPAVVS